MTQTTEDMQRAAIDREVARVFRDAAELSSLMPVIARYAHERGWIFAAGRDFDTWYTRSLASYKPGPRFQNLGDLLQWLLEQEDKPAR